MPKANYSGINVDPICGMEVQDTKFKSAYKGKQYNFCSSRCKERFDNSPDKYAK
jgi:YHS domain-containing protein